MKTPLISSLSLLLSSLAFLLAIGCGSDVGSGGNASNDGGAQGTDAALPDAEVDPSCGAQTAEIPLLEINEPPDLLVVLDKSNSMTGTILEFPLTFPFPVKWDVMKDALAGITTQYDTNIRFGLSVFPEESICGISPGANVDIGLGKASAINSFMSSQSPGGNTPAQLALQDALSTYQSTAANPAGQYVLFATDGIPNCGGADMNGESGPETISAVSALKAQGIDTFVLGFGDPLGLDPNVLNDAAQAGGQARSGGPPYFYEADDAASLEAALLEIAGGIILPSCSFTVTETPPDPDLVTVSINGTPIPRDGGHLNGWDYHPDANTITFFGDACAAVQEGDTSISFVFGCPGPVID